MILMSLIVRIARGLRAYKDTRLLEQLDDAALKDIGLDRACIWRVVRQPPKRGGRQKPRDSEADTDLFGSDLTRPRAPRG